MPTLEAIASRCLSPQATNISKFPRESIHNLRANLFGSLNRYSIVKLHCASTILLFISWSYFCPINCQNLAYWLAGFFARSYWPGQIVFDIWSCHFLGIVPVIYIFFNSPLTHKEKWMPVEERGVHWPSHRLDPNVAERQPPAPSAIPGNRNVTKSNLALAVSNAESPSYVDGPKEKMKISLHLRNQ